MKYGLLIFFFFLSGVSVLHGQGPKPDSLASLLTHSKRDTNRVNLLLDIADAYYFTKPDSCLLYAEQALSLSRELNYERAEGIALNTAGEALRFLGDYPRSLKMQFEALPVYRQNKNKWGEARTLSFIGFTYVEFGQFTSALRYLFDAYELSQQIPDTLMATFIFTNTGHVYDMLGKPDSALYYQLRAFRSFNTIEFIPPLKSLILTRLGIAYANVNMMDSALIYYRLALQNAYQFNDKVNTSKAQNKIAELYAASRMYDSSLYYARLSFASAKSSAQKKEILQASILLMNLYRSAGNADSSLFYSETASAIKDSLYGPQKFRQLQLLVIEEQARQQKIQQEEEQFKNRLKYIVLLTALGIFLLVAFILFKSNRQKQRSNILLREQKNKIEETLTQLKATQSQLIQSEKMASLGELTAGIAHEIQNPLNFVNNFSDVNKELLTEMNEEIDRGNLDEVKAIAKIMIDNEEKINNHGRRADAIVKGMLQHSRMSSGQKEPTDINTLADEYLRLAYHGLRAKDKSFNVKTETEFDNRIGAIKIVPQDIGRVLLNLFNNAFYAVNEKQKNNPNGYEPIVTVSTKKEKNKVEIKVKDNGNGISQKVLDKIFQPFFTTKPTGQGTGLGLSLSYDIVKAHGGELQVETKENEGSEFIVSLPAH